MSMKLRTIGSLVGLSLTLLAVKPVAAHHSFDAEYDSKRTTNISGTVTKVDWVNPHAFVFIDTKDEAGVVKSYKIEMGPTYALTRGGWKRETVKVGDRGTVEAVGRAE